MLKRITISIFFFIIVLNVGSQSLFDSIGCNNNHQPLPNDKIIYILNYCENNMLSNPNEVRDILIDARLFMREHKDVKKQGEYYYVLANYLFLIDDVDSAAYYYREALRELNVSSIMRKVNSLITLSLIESNAGNIIGSKIYLDKVNTLIQELGVSSYTGQVYQQYAHIYMAEGNYSKALVYFKKAVDEYRINANLLKIGYVYSDLAEMYILLDNYPLAINYLKKGGAIYQDGGDSVGVANNYLQRGIAYLKLAKYTEALLYLKKANNSFDYLNDLKKSGDVFSYMGKANNKLGNFKKSRSDLNKALEIKIKFEDKKGQAMVLSGLGDLYNAKDRVAISQKYFIKSLNCIEYIDDKQLKLGLYLKLADNYVALNNYREAYKYQVKYRILEHHLLEQEALVSVRNVKIILNEEIDGLEKKKDRIQVKHDLLLSNRRYVSIVFIISILLLILSVLLVLVLFRKQRVRNRILSTQLSIGIEKRDVEIGRRKTEFDSLEMSSDRMFKIASKNMREPYMVLQRLVGQVIESEESCDNISFEDDQLVMALNLLGNVLSWADIQQDRFNLNPQKLYVHSLLENVIAVQKVRAEAKKIKINYSLEYELSIYADRSSVLFILRNIIENAIKFSTNNSEIAIGVLSRGDDVVINITDCGVGLTKEQVATLFSVGKSYLSADTHGEKGGGLGLWLSKEFVSRNFGSIEIDSSIAKGTTVSVVLPTK